jgi:hypothetical protein
MRINADPDTGQALPSLKEKFYMKKYFTVLSLRTGRLYVVKHTYVGTVQTPSQYGSAFPVRIRIQESQITAQHWKNDLTLLSWHQT